MPETRDGCLGVGVDPESGDQLLAALGATTGKNLAAVRGSHTGTKPVCAGAADLAGLIGAFHGASPKKGRKGYVAGAVVSSRERYPQVRAPVYSPHPLR